jgi:DNA polymerase III epsilon subunit-like protein
MLETLVNPGMPIPGDAHAIHGITDEMVASAPGYVEVRREVLAICAGSTVLMYNGAFDCGFWPGLRRVSRAVCVMEWYAETCCCGRWASLGEAAWHAGHAWAGDAHRALADALACRSVAEYLTGSTALQRWMEPRRCGSRGDATLSTAGRRSASRRRSCPNLRSRRRTRR